VIKKNAKKMKVPLTRNNDLIMVKHRQEYNTAEKEKKQKCYNRITFIISS